MEQQRRSTEWLMLTKRCENPYCHEVIKVPPGVSNKRYCSNKCMTICRKCDLKASDPLGYHLESHFAFEGAD